MDTAQGYHRRPRLGEVLAQCHAQLAPQRRPAKLGRTVDQNIVGRLELLGKCGRVGRVEGEEVPLRGPEAGVGHGGSVRDVRRTVQ